MRLSRGQTGALIAETLSRGHLFSIDDRDLVWGPAIPARQACNAPRAD
jgi:hypothetical protein